MADTFDILWTAVPGSVNGSTVTLKLVPTFQPGSDPAVTPGSTSFGVDKLVNWPATVSGLTFSLYLNGSPVPAPSNPGQNYVLRPVASFQPSAWNDIIWPEGKGSAQTPKITSTKLTRDPNAFVTTSHLHQVATHLTNLYGTFVSSFFDRVSRTASNDGPSLQRVQHAAWAYDRDNALGPLKWQAENLDGESNAEAWSPLPDQRIPGVPIDPDIEGNPVAVPSDALNERCKRNLARLGQGGEFGLQQCVRQRISSLTYNTLPKMKEGAPRDSHFGGVFLQHALFHSRAPDRTPGVRRAQPTGTFRVDASTNGTSPSAINDPDILARITLARNYPALLEPLGLVLTFLVPVSFFASIGDDATLSIQVNSPRPANAPDLTGSHYSTTAIKVNKTMAVGSPGGTNITSINVPVTPNPPGVTGPLFPRKGGFLDLGHCLADADKPESRFVMSTIDLDGLALKLIQMAASLANVESGRAVILAGNVVQAFGVNEHRKLNTLAERNLDYSNAAALLDPRTRARIQFTSPSDRAWTYKTLHLGSNAIPGAVVAHGRTIWSGGEAVATEWWFQRPENTHVRGRVRPRTAARLVTQTTENTGMPAVQSRGISMIWKDRPQNLLNRQAQPAAPAAVVYAEDLIYGYAPDVAFKHPGTSDWSSWLSLTDRTETFAQDPALSPAVTAPDHGQPGRGTDAPLRLTATRTVDGTDDQQAVPSGDLHVGTILFRWDGWNLSTAETASVQADGEDALTMPDNNGDKTITVPGSQWSLQPKVGNVKKSIPPLRYGWSYKFRVRLMDITATAPEISSHEPDACASHEMRYLRYEPVPVPELLLDSPPGHHFVRGRQLHRLVITEDTPIDIRWVVPPRANLRLVQRHGVLDGVKHPRGFNGVGFVSETGEFPRVPLVNNDGKLPVSDGQKETQDNDGKPPVSDGQEEAQDSAPIRQSPGQPPRKPYFPDPLADGFAWAADLPGATSPSLTNHDFNEAHRALRASFYAHSEWPDAHPWKLVLKATEEPQPFQTCDETERSLTLHLPAGFSGTLRLGSSLGATGADVTGFYELGRTHLDQLYASQSHAQRVKLQHHFRRTITAGALPFVTPQITLDLVYAVPQPRTAPVIDYFSGVIVGGDTIIERAVGKPLAHLKIGAIIDVQTTGKLIFKASWNIPLDDQADGVSRSAGSAVLGEQRIDLAPAQDQPIAHDYCELTHNLPSTGFFLVAYTVTALTRFVEQFPKQSADELSKVSAPRYVEVLNCARPKPVTFLRPIPVYDWQHTVDDQSHPPVFSNQRSGGVRFYLDRPWFGTGEDEVVGIVMPRGQELLPEVVSYWGADIARKKRFHGTSAPGRRAGGICHLPPGRNPRCGQSRPGTPGELL